MRKLFLILGIFALIGMAGAVLPSNPPYILCGHVYDDDGHLVIGELVTIQNSRSMVTYEAYTDNSGVYMMDCLNFENGYKNGDEIKIHSKYGEVIVKVDMEYEGIQADINRPKDIPVSIIITGVVLVPAAFGAYYYIKKKKEEGK